MIYKQANYPCGFAASIFAIPGSASANGRQPAALVKRHGVSKN